MYSGHPLPEDAVDMAYAADDAFEQRIGAAELLAGTMRNDGGVIDEERLGQYSEANDRYLNLLSAAEVLMTPIAAFEIARTAEEAEESLASPEVWGYMSAEQRTFTFEARTALATNFKEYGVTEGSLRVLMTEFDNKNKFTLVHTGSGVDIGDRKEDFDRARSYNSVMESKNDALFQVEVGGATYDARRGMTDEVYDAKVEDARARGDTLPDSQQLSQETGDLWTWTMLTGNGLTAGGGVQIRRVSGGQVRRYVRDPVYDYQALRVCPAVEIPDLTS